MVYLTTFNHWIRKLSFIKSKEVKYRVWVNKKPAGKILEKNKKIKIRFFFCRKICSIYQNWLVSASGDAPISTLYLAKKSCLKSKIWNMQMFCSFLYLFNTLLHGTKKRLNLISLLNCNYFKFILFLCLLSFRLMHLLTLYFLVFLQCLKILIKPVFLLVFLRF